MRTTIGNLLTRLWPRSREQTQKRTALSESDILSSVSSTAVTRSGIAVTERSAMTYVAVYAATKILAEAVGMLPVLIFRGDEDGDDQELDLSHPLRPLLRWQPNPEMSASTWRETMQVHLCLYGNSYNRIFFDARGQISEIRPLDPGRTRPERKAGQLRYRWQSQSGGSEEFAPEEILHIPGLCFDGLIGYSPIALARQNIGLGLAAETFGANFFGSGTNMTGIISFPQRLTPEQRKQIQDAWQQQYSGLINSGRTVLMDSGATYTRIGIPPEDCQFLEVRKFSVLDICRLYRIPPHMMADLEKATYASIEHQSLEFLIYTLMPWLNKYELEFKRKLFGITSDYFATFDATQLLRGDMAAQQQFFAAGRQHGWLTVNEIRRKLRMPQVEGGDVLLQPLNMVPVKVQPQRVQEDERMRYVISIMQPGIEDVIAQFLKREKNALQRAEQKQISLQARQNWENDFYLDHNSKFRMALLSQVRAICRLLEMNVDTQLLQAIIDPIVLEKHGINDDIDGEPGRLADKIMESIVRLREVQHA